METAHSPPRGPPPQHFDTSYKGWKHLFAGPADYIARYFDTSYKGWKLHAFCITPITDLISILPIRDGNPTFLLESAFLITISILPIRDGNSLLEGLRARRSVISILPIRDGN